MSSDPETPDAPDGLAHQPEDQLESEAEEETLNDTTMQDEDDAGAERTLQNGKPYTISDENTDYSVFNNPTDLAAMRQRLFDIDEPIELPVADFEALFSFVDNVWRKMRTGEAQSESTVKTEYYACRLRRGTAQKPHVPRPTPEGKQSRKKRAREDKTCGMTLKVVYSPGAVQSCTVSRAVDNFQRHTHDLDYIDSTKRNSGIMDTARREAIKGFLPASIYWKMWEEPDKMQAAGGKYMKVSDVRNVQYAWRQEHQQTVLKAHTGFNQTRAPRQRQGTPTKPPFQPSMQPGVFGRLEPMKPEVPRPEQANPLPIETLQYPQHARDFLEPYLPDPKLANVRSRPHITLSWASSLDGRITLLPGIRTAISGPETRAMTHYLRSRHDAVLIGVSTAIADDPALNCRLANPAGVGGLPVRYQPRPIIIDPHARLHIRPEMNILKNASEGRGKAPWVVVAPGAMLHPLAVSTLKSHGGEYLMINDYHPQSGGLSWEGVFNVLLREGIRSVMIEGGGIVLSELLRLQNSHLVDSVVLTIAPTWFGKAGVAVTPDPTFDPAGRPIASRLRNVRWQPMGDADVVLCGHVGYDRPPNGILPGIEEFSQAASDPNHQQAPLQPFPPKPPSGPAPGSGPAAVPAAGLAPAPGTPAPASAAPSAAASAATPSPAPATTPQVPAPSNAPS